MFSNVLSDVQQLRDANALVQISLISRRGTWQANQDTRAVWGVFCGKP